MTERALASIETDLDSEIRLKSAVIHEELGRQFHIDAVIQSSSPIDPDQLLGLPVVVRLHGEQGERVFHGYCVRIELLAPGVGGIGYRLTIRSILWFLSRTTDSRIFQNESVIDILKSILEKYDFDEIEPKLQKEYEPLPYCVQYQETDHAFFHRLLERHGIYYYFVHSDSGHRIVLCDDPASHDFLEGRKEIEYYKNPSTATQTPQILEWNGEYSYRTSTVAVADYDFRKPRTRLQTRDSRENKNALAEHEFFRYPGGFEDVEKGEDIARRLLEIEQEDRAVFHARSNVMELKPGFLFELKAQDPLLSKAFDGSYLITQITHHVVVGDPESGNSADDSYYENSIRVIPSETPFRLDLNTPAPRITGPQTAIVVGPEGEEIYTDEYGRIKVQFHWDRYGKRDENSSCWIRVAQMWAGKRWGAVHLPRVGQEVIVEFLDGDPDRPIVTGRVYNGEQMPPYDLPSQKTRSGIKTHSVEGSASNYNEIRFEDKKGAEEIHIHAERNLRTTVENDEISYVGHDRKRKVDGTESCEVAKDRNFNVGGNQSFVISQDSYLQVCGSSEIQIFDERNLSIGQKDNVSIGPMGRTVNIEGPLTHNVQGTYSGNIQGPSQQIFMSNFTITANGGMQITAPAGISIVDTQLNMVGSKISNMHSNETNFTGFSYGGCGVKIEVVGSNIGIETTKASKTIFDLGEAMMKNDKAWARVALAEATDLELSTLKILF